MSSNPVHGEVFSIQHYVIEFINDLWQVSGFLRVLLFPPPIKLTATITEILFKVALNNLNQPTIQTLLLWINDFNSTEWPKAMWIFVMTFCPSSVPCLLSFTFYILIISSETAWPIGIKLFKNDVYKVFLKWVSDCCLMPIAWW